MSVVIVIAHTPTPEGAAALDRGIAEAQLRGARLVVVSRGPQRHRHAHEPVDLTAMIQRLEVTGIEHSVRQPTGDYDFAAEVLETATREDADLIVIGIRHSTPVGKLFLASPAQRILLEARCPVTAVKAADPAPTGPGSGSS